MSILTKLLGGLSAKSETVSWPESFNQWLRGSRATEAGVSISRDDAMRIGAYHACVRLISLTLAGFPVDFLRKDAENRRTPMPMPPRWGVRPNADQLWPEFMGQLTSAAVNHGEVFLDVRDRGADGFPLNLYVVDPLAVTVVRDADTNVKSFLVNTTKGLQKRTGEEFRHWKLLQMPGSDRGLSTLDCALQELGIARASQSYLASYYANGGTVSAVLQFPPEVSKEMAKEYLDQFRELYAGAGNHHKVAGLVGGEYKPMASDNDKGQYLQLRSWSAVDIARMHGIHPTRIGEGLETPMFGNSIEQFNMVVYQDAIQPYVSLFEAGFRELLPPPAYLKFNTSAMLRADTKTRMESYRVLFGMGSIKADEIRAKEDMDPLPDGRGQHTYVMTNLGPVDADGLPQVPAKQGAPNG